MSTTSLGVRARSRDVSPRARVHPGRAGRLPIPGSARARHLRRQGQEPAQPADVVLRRCREPATSNPADGDHRGQGRVDGGQHRSRGAAAGIQLDQGVRSALQHPLPRRQVVPGAGGHPQRGVSPADGLSRPAAQGCALFRAVLARVGHPGNAGSAHPEVPARTCSAGVFKRHKQIDRPCLLGYIDKCSAPCVGRVTAEQHRQIVATSATSCPAKPTGSPASWNSG